MSQTHTAPAEWAMADTALMSVIFSNGLDGVSTQTNLVLGRIAPSTSAGSVISRKVVSSPQGAKISFSILAVPWYTSLGAKTWSPGERTWNTAMLAADPDEKAAAARPSSNAARHCSRELRLGFPLRE